MSIETVAQFLAALKESGVLEPDQLREMAPKESTFTDPKKLARILIKQGWLTAYQANQVFFGKGKYLVLGAYVLQDRVGEGGMGQVYKAKHRRMARTVALKIIRRERLNSPEAIRRFEKEAMAAAKLSHPNIVLAFDFNQVGDTHFLAMEYVDGTDLARLVKDKGPVPIPAACEYMRQAALGLQHAHEHGLIHRDIKPHNLLLSGKPGTPPVVKILDMGLARLTDGAGADAGITQENMVVGTPDFIAPEQARNSRMADIRTDLYSLGCTFYFMLTGQVPYPEGTATERLLKHQLDEPAPVEALRPEVPPEVAGVVRKLMAKKPDDRYQTPSELAVALQNTLTGLSAVAATPAGGFHASQAAAIQAEPADPWAGVFSSSDIGSSPSAPRLRKPPFKGRWVAVYSAGGVVLLALVLGIVAMAKKAETTKKDQASNSATAAKEKRPNFQYVKKAARVDAILSTLRANGMPTLEGKWHCIGPFAYSGRKGVDTVYPPETEINLQASYEGFDGQSVSWQESADFRVGKPYNLAIFPHNQKACCYLYFNLETPEAMSLPISLGCDDALKVWLNGKVVPGLASPGNFAPDRHQVVLGLRTGANQLLFKVANTSRDWPFYILPLFPPDLEAAYGDRLRDDFPSQTAPPPITPIKINGAIEAEILPIRECSPPDLEVFSRNLLLFHGNSWSAGKDLRCFATKVGDWVDLEFRPGRPGKYQMSVNLTRDRDLGIVQFHVNGKRLGEPIDCYDPRGISVQEFELGTIELERGPARLRVEVVGTNKDSIRTRYGWGLDCLMLRVPGRNTK